MNPPERISSGLVGDVAVHRRTLQRPSRAENHDHESHLLHVVSDRMLENWYVLTQIEFLPPGHGSPSHGAVVDTTVVQPRSHRVGP